MPDNEKSIDVVFTGLIREYEVFKNSIKDLVQLRKKGIVGKIILATRIGESAKHPEMLEVLKENKIEIIEKEDPEIYENSPYYGGRDFVWRQMKSFEVGLNAVAQGRFVLKTRSDVYINPKFIEKLAKEKETILKIKRDLPKGNIFKYKIWVPWFEIGKPFFMADECFFGLREDLEKLYNYNKDYFEKYDLGTDVHHVMRYIDPFIEKYPIFISSLNKFSKDRLFKNFVKRNFPKSYEKLKRFSFLKNASEKNRLSILQSRLNNEEYLSLLGAYYYVLYSHFYIDLVSYKDQIVFRDFYSGELPRSDVKTAENNFTKEKVRFPGSGMIYLYEMGFINALLENKLNKTELSEKLYNAVKKFETGN